MSEAVRGAPSSGGVNLVGNSYLIPRPGVVILSIWSRHTEDNGQNRRSSPLLRDPLVPYTRSMSDPCT